MAAFRIDARAHAYLPRGTAHMPAGLMPYAVSALATGLCRMGMHKGAADPGRPAGPLPLARLVECLQKLGGVGEAQLTFKRHMPTQVCLPFNGLRFRLEEGPRCSAQPSFSKLCSNTCFVKTIPIWRYRGLIRR